MEHCTDAFVHLYYFWKKLLPSRKVNKQWRCKDNKELKELSLKNSMECSLHPGHEDKLKGSVRKSGLGGVTEPAPDQELKNNFPHTGLCFNTHQCHKLTRCQTTYRREYNLGKSMRNDTGGGNSQIPTIGYPSRKSHHIFLNCAQIQLFIHRRAP